MFTNDFCKKNPDIIKKTATPISPPLSKEKGISTENNWPYLVV